MLLTDPRVRAAYSEGAGIYRIIPAALEEADRLDPRELRRYVEERFSPLRMVRDYAKAFGLAIDRARA